MLRKISENELSLLIEEVDPYITMLRGLPKDQFIDTLAIIAYPYLKASNGEDFGNQLIANVSNPDNKWIETFLHMGMQKTALTLLYIFSGLKFHDKTKNFIGVLEAAAFLVEEE